jgi:hypothetical protein
MNPKWKKFVFAGIVLVTSWSVNAQSILSKSKMIAVVIKERDGKLPKFNGVEFRSFTLYGTERSVGNFIINNKEITAACNCLLLSREGCLRSLEEDGQVIEDLSQIKYFGKEVTLSIPPNDPRAYNELLASFRNANRPLCTSDVCITVCSGSAEVCYSVQCKDSAFDVCYDGNFRVTGTNDNISVEAEMN